MKNLKGTEKQIKFANDLLQDFEKAVKMKEDRGKGGEKTVLKRSFLDKINKNTEAGNVINMINNWAEVEYSIENKKADLEYFLNK